MSGSCARSSSAASACLRMALVAPLSLVALRIETCFGSPIFSVVMVSPIKSWILKWIQKLKP